MAATDVAGIISKPGVRQAILDAARAYQAEQAELDSCWIVFMDHFRPENGFYDLSPSQQRSREQDAFKEWMRDQP